MHGYWMEDTPRPARRQHRHVRAVHAAGQAARVRHPRRQLQRAARAAYCPQGDNCNKTCAPTATPLWRAAIGCPRNGDLELRLRLRLLRHRRSRRVVDVAGVRRDALREPRRVPAHSGRRATPRAPAAEQLGQPDAELGRHALRRLDLVARRREPLAERDEPAEARRRRRARARACTRTSSATSSACPTTTTTRSPTTTATSPATGR